jgi:mRNA-degrading endonuclease toxin of MazEF toxin-antitoxin module
MSDPPQNRPKPGVIVYVDWRDKHYPPEPGKGRPAIVIGDPTILPVSLNVLTVIPLTSIERLALPRLSIRIEPEPQNGLTKRSYALAWNVQTVAMQRVIEITTATITSAEVAALKRRIAECLAL